MKIRTKITIYIGVLLAIITLFGYYAAQTTERIKLNTENILADNYNSVKYAQKMLWAIHNFEIDSIAAVTTFEANLSLQKKNISENSEKQHTEQLERLFEVYKSDRSIKNIISLSE